MSNVVKDTMLDVMWLEKSACIKIDQRPPQVAKEAND
jgi:hypothetical protein